MNIQPNNDYIYVDVYKPRVIKIHVNKIDKTYASIRRLLTRDIIGYNIIFTKLDTTMTQHNYLPTSIFGYLLEPNKEKAVKTIKKIIKKRTYTEKNTQMFKVYDTIRNNTRQIIQMIKQLEV